ncbi:RluA family pseudouridine synthase [Thalassolituus sp.]|jgi:tRNA pseudouridine32 synthase/23S rRNA pseudouridine746 synthase|uniref:RluA family pseudouridine synthase n=1 Tax=Thalassolituus sp. TaxID=2030822 RepID=UPI002A8069E9|nr:RluA family pseudouridine synthase [Thalassolituus sp.]
MPLKEQPEYSLVDDFVVPVCSDFVEILYQDDDILLINKPSGILSLSGKNPLNWDSVHHRLIYGQEGMTPAFPEAKLPHRLDFGTSGVMVVGLNARAAQHLNQQFQAGTVQKRYIAVLDGWLAEDHGQISAAIAKDKTQFPRVKICDSTGKAAISDYVVLQRLDKPRRSIVQFSPITGRTHQLRIHSQSIGHPILGCDLYSNDHSEQMADRLQLHASDLYFEHPTSGEQYHGHSPYAL